MTAFHRATLEDCHQYAGVVVVIDVLRAFTTAPAALSRGASRIYLVSSVEEALALRNERPNIKAMGEVRGIKPEEFDYGNSPVELLRQDLRGVTLVQRTTAGTQGVVKSVNAEILIAASFVNASATARYILSLDPSSITFVITGAAPNKDAAEDFACADYLEALLSGETPDFAPYADRVRKSRWGKVHTSPESSADMAFALTLDKFDFPAPVCRKNGKLVINGLSAA